MERKTDQVRAHLEAGNPVAALRIAKGFKLGLTKKERATLVRGHECLVDPSFYRQLGHDTDAQINEALSLCSSKWGETINA